jgi:hypothetical protein
MLRKYYSKFSIFRGKGMFSGQMEAFHYHTNNNFKKITNIPQSLDLIAQCHFYLTFLQVNSWKTHHFRIGMASRKKTKQSFILRPIRVEVAIPDFSRFPEIPFFPTSRSSGTSARKIPEFRDLVSA